MGKKYKIVILGIICAVLFLMFVYISLKYKGDTLDTNPTQKNMSIIEKNYNSEFHHLALNSQNLGKIPDLCTIVEGTKYVDDVWSIDLSNNGIKKIDQDLSCFLNLSELNLSFNQISKIENLDNLKFLKKLDLGNNQISKIENLNHLIIQDLHLGYNQISAVQGLESLVSLINLKLQHNQISDISGLKKLSNLVELKLEFNLLDDSDIEVLQDLKNLKVITVAENIGINKDTIDKLNEFSLKSLSSTGSSK